MKTLGCECTARPIRPRSAVTGRPPVRNPTDAHFSRTAGGDELVAYASSSCTARRSCTVVHRVAGRHDGEGLRRRRHRRARAAGGAPARRRRPRRQRAGAHPTPAPTWLRRWGPPRSAPSCSTPGPMRRAVAGHDVVCNLATHIPPTRARRQARGLGRERPHPHRGVAHTWSTPPWPAGPRATCRSRSPFSTATGARPGSTSPSPVEPVGEPALGAGGRSPTPPGSPRPGATGVVLRFAAFYGPDSDSTLDMIRLARRRIALERRARPLHVVDHHRRRRRRRGGVAVGPGRALQRRRRRAGDRAGSSSPPWPARSASGRRSSPRPAWPGSAGPRGRR